MASFKEITYRISCGKQLWSRPVSRTERMHRVFSVGAKTCTKHSN